MPYSSASEDAVARHQVEVKFHLFDFNKDGVIDRSELGEVLQYLDRKLWDNGRIDRLFGVLDTKSDGVIDLDEFASWLLASTPNFVYTRDLQSFRNAVGYMSVLLPAPTRPKSCTRPKSGGASSVPASYISSSLPSARDTASRPMTASTDATRASSASRVKGSPVKKSQVYYRSALSLHPPESPIEVYGDQGTNENMLSEGVQISLPTRPSVQRTLYFPSPDLSPAHSSP